MKHFEEREKKRQLKIMKTWLKTFFPFTSTLVSYGGFWGKSKRYFQTWQHSISSLTPFHRRSFIFRPICFPWKQLLMFFDGFFFCEGRNLCSLICHKVEIYLRTFVLFIAEMIGFDLMWFLIFATMLLTLILSLKDCQV